MRILFDHQAFDKQTHGGISRSFTQLYLELRTNNKVDLAVRETSNTYLRESGFTSDGYRMRHFTPIPCYKFNELAFRICNKLFHWGYGTDYNQRRAIKLLKDGDFDIFHPTYFFDYYLSYLNGKPFALTVHDMTPEIIGVDPDNFEIQQKAKLMPKASVIIAVSETTKRDILRFHPDINPEKIHVVYHGPSFSPAINPNKNSETYGKYILYVGHRFGYKNFCLFVKHIQPFLERHKEIHVVCTGQPLFDFEIDKLKDIGLLHRFKTVFTQTDQELADLYRNSLAFVYPSSAEGFGMPILEAFQSQTICLINNASCLPEIGGDAATYFEISDNKSNLSEKLEEVYGLSSAQREYILQKQLLRLADFSWTQSANRLISAYKYAIEHTI